MENLLKQQSVRVTRCILDRTEECGVGCDFTLPDYCPDMTMILKCVMTPLVQSRQWTGDRLMVDGTAVLRILYLDEDRCRVHSAEFSQPFSSALQTDGPSEPSMLSVDLSVKYVNCRAVTPRRIEVRGGIVVKAYAECADTCDMYGIEEDDALITRWDELTVSSPAGMAEKIITVSESLEFPHTLPAAEMLLGGECRVDVRECKLLTGKAIVKGNVYVHQLFTDDVDKGTTHCLDYVIPYSQILDIDSAYEGQPYTVNALLLSDTERCSIGPDGANTVLEVTAKLLIQLQVYEQDTASLLLDAYRTDCPVSADTQMKSFCSYLGCCMENTVLPMQLELPTVNIQELLDVWITLQEHQVAVSAKKATITGHMAISMLLRDDDGQIAYFERPEEFQLEFAAQGNLANAAITVGELRYRVVDNKLELQVGLGILLRFYECCDRPVICNLTVHKDQPYPRQKASVLMYYAQPGESVWDIGRNCHASQEQICRENGLTDDHMVSPTWLVVPLA